MSQVFGRTELASVLYRLQDAAIARVRRICMKRSAESPFAPVEIVSFGYGHTGDNGKPIGAPAAHLTFDLRTHFKDPHVSPELRNLAADDYPVIQAVMGTPGIHDLLTGMLCAVLAYLSGPADAPVMVAIGCAGGRHRSAVVATYLADHLEGYEVPVTLTHRDIERPVIQRDPRWELRA
jgi:UPF0042 nucleotide-binding protein